MLFVVHITIIRWTATHVFQSTLFKVKVVVPGTAGIIFFGAACHDT